MKLKQTLYILFALYLFTRLYFLFTFPPFTDESLYIRYGQLGVHNHDFFWASLTYLHRQPLAVWIIGLGSYLFGNPLFGARLLTFLINLPVFFCIWDTSKKLFTSKVAIYSIVTLVVNPLFIFTQSTALMDGLLFAISCYILWIFSNPWRHRYHIESVAIGILIGVGIWIKSTALMLIPPVIAGLLLKLFTNELSKKRFALHCSLIFLFMVTVLIPLIFHKGSDIILREPETFVISTRSIAEFPIQVWFRNLAATLISLVIYFTPIGILSMICASTVILNRSFALFTFWWSLPFAITILFGKNIVFRYSVIGTIALIPFLGFGIQKIISNSKNIIVTCIILGFPALLTGWFLFSPPDYFRIFPSNIGEQSYAIGWPSGYGIPELTSWIDTHVPEHKTVVLAVADSPGNPSDYLLSYYFFSDRVKVMFVTLTSLEEFRKIEPMTKKYPIFLATRGSLLKPEFQPYLKTVIQFQKPFNDDVIGLYKIEF